MLAYDLTPVSQLRHGATPTTTLVPPEPAQAWHDASVPALPPELATRLVESVPNVSEGRRLDVIERLAIAISAVPGVHLLDRTSDASHNRSVFTLAGPAAAVCDALAELVGGAVRDI